jgi:DNA-binding MarR family transcriptional regulator
MSMNSFEEISSSLTAKNMLIGALLRIPAETIHRRILHDLNAAGFEGLSQAHMAVLRFPGPDGVRPGVLAERAGMSKQAMNRLLGSLEDLGYISRSDALDESRARIVRFTKRGHAAWTKTLEVLREIEREWRAELGPKEFSQLKELLFRIWKSPLVR